MQRILVLLHILHFQIEEHLTNFWNIYYFNKFNNVFRQETLKTILVSAKKLDHSSNITIITK